MADNVAVTPGVGATIATDDVSGVQYQRIKLVTAEDGASEPIGDTDLGASRALWVDPRPNSIKVIVTPTISTSVYASGDCVGGLQTITAAARQNGGSGVLQSVVLLDKTQAQRAAIDLLVFDDTVTSAGDNSPVAFSDADMAKCIGIIRLPNYNDPWPGTPLNSLAQRLDVGLPFVCASGASVIYVQAVVRATPTYVATTDLQFAYTIFRD